MAQSVTMTHTFGWTAARGLGGCMLQTFGFINAMNSMSGAFVRARHTCLAAAHTRPSAAFLLLPTQRCCCALPAPRATAATVHSQA